MEHSDIDFRLDDNKKCRGTGIIRFYAQFPRWIQKQAWDPEADLQFLGEFLAVS